MLSQEQQREILALGLLALALFLLLALIPAPVLGLLGEGRFPSGNVMGDVGASLHAALFYALGIGSFLLPLLLALGGLRSGEWLSVGWSLRLGALGAGLLFLLPIGAHVIAADSSWAGALGTWLSASVGGGVGRLWGPLPS